MKTFVLTITETDDGVMCEAVNNGFDAYALVGLLECKMQDIVAQVQAQTKHDRTWVHDGKKFKITESKGE